MARRYSACLVRSLKRWGESSLKVESRCFAAQNVAAVQNSGGRQFDSRRVDSFRSCNNAVAVEGYRRSVSSYKETDDSTVPERVRGKDRLILRGCRFQGYHGVMEEERKLGQKFVVDMDAWLDLTKCGNTDNLEDSVSYAEVFSAIQKVVEGPSRQLIEFVANEIACEVLEAYPQITEVRVRIYKPAVAVAGFVDKLGIEIYRTPSDFVSKS